MGGYNLDLNKYSYLVIVSKALMYFLQVGVLNNFQNGIFNSRRGTFSKNMLIASIKFCVSGSVVSSSRHPSFWSNATLAIAKQ